MHIPMSKSRNKIKNITTHLLTSRSFTRDVRRLPPPRPINTAVNIDAARIIHIIMAVVFMVA